MNHLNRSLTVAFIHFSTQLEATGDTRGAARRDQVAVGVQDLELNSFGELVRVIIDLDLTREAVRLYPGSSGAKDKNLGRCLVGVTVYVSPDTRAGSGNCGELACGRKG